jgi:hypothetical protein
VRAVNKDLEALGDLRRPVTRETVEELETSIAHHTSHGIELLERISVLEARVQALQLEVNQAAGGEIYSEDGLLGAAGAQVSAHSPTPWLHATDYGQVGSIELPDGSVIAQAQALIGDVKSAHRQANAAYIVKCVNGYAALRAIAAEHRSARLITLEHAAVLAAALRVLADIPLEDFGKQNKPEYPLMGWNGHQLLAGHVLTARQALIAFNAPKKAEAAPVAEPAAVAGARTLKG